MKYFVTNQQDDRRIRRAAVVEWTLAGVFLLLVAVALARAFHAF
jgi:hypothetical protein